MVGWLVGCKFCWVGWLIGWLIRWLAGGLLGWLVVGRSVGCGLFVCWLPLLSESVARHDYADVRVQQGLGDEIVSTFDANVILGYNQ